MRLSTSGGKNFSKRVVNLGVFKCCVRLSGCAYGLLDEIVHMKSCQWISDVNLCLLTQTPVDPWVTVGGCGLVHDRLFHKKSRTPEEGMNATRSLFGKNFLAKEEGVHLVSRSRWTTRSTSALASHDVCIVCTPYADMMNH